MARPTLAKVGEVGHGLTIISAALFIQRSEYRDTQAIQAKLDELLRAEGNARNELTTIDEKEPEEIKEHRDVAKKQ
jgi:low affinity Fe/Cu permease